MANPTKVFSLKYWEGPTIGVDASDPNAAAPAASRVRRVFRDPGSSLWPSTIKVFAKDGTTITVQPWFFDDVQQVWLKLCPTITATPATPGTNTGTPNVDGALIFFQLTVVTATTIYGWHFG